MTLSLLAFLALTTTALTLAACRDRSTGPPDRPQPPAPPHSPANHLAGSSSPYLLQHAHNPVHWYPWGPQALELARRQDKPIFLSIGYATCHWCHVMARESFEDDRVAELLNRHYIAIKVDREQRPDLDSQYMLATQLMTGHGGWPNNLWLTPDGRPWFAATYLPRDDRFGQPGFINLLQRLADVWQNRRDQVEQQADRLAQAIADYSRLPDNHHVQSLGPVLLEQALERVVADYDPQFAGFGTAPKFPPHATLALLLAARPAPDDRLGRILTATLDAMADGGLYDQVGFGFHRYATDRRWHVPHFEKMLYDNAQLLQAYATAYHLTGRRRYARIAGQIVQWLDREMTDPGGAFYCALDADSQGHEGLYYLWTWQQVLDVLGPDDGRLFCDLYGVRPEGNFTDPVTGRPAGSNILHRTGPLDQWADRLHTDATALRRHVEAMREKLLIARRRRPAPARDDKVLTAWNGLMIAALADSARLLDRPDDLHRAARAADFILHHLRDSHGRLLRCWRDGRADQKACLDDYAYLLVGLVGLHRAAGQTRWLEQACTLADQMLEHFQDPAGGGFFFTADDQPTPLGRSKNPLAGGNVPQPNGMAALALYELGRLADRPHYIETADRTLAAFAPLMLAAPDSAGHLVLAVHLGLQATGRDHLTVGPPRPVRVELLASHHQVRPGQSFQLAVRLVIAPGYHLYAADSDPRQATATILSAQPTGQVTFGPVRWPPARQMADPVLGRTVDIYQGTVLACLPATVQDPVTGPLRIDLRLTCQPCDSRRCLPPLRRTLSIDLPVADKALPNPDFPHPCSPTQEPPS